MTSTRKAVSIAVSLLLVALPRASAQRGSSGGSPEFDWRLEPAGSGEVKSAAMGLESKAATITVQLKGFEPNANEPLLTIRSESGQDVLSLKTQGAGRDRLLNFAMKLDSHEEPLSVGVPVAMLGTASRHELILRYIGFRLDLFVDGVLMDEEWPTGSISAGKALQVRAGGAITGIGVWKRVLADAEIADRSGSASEVALRADAFFGPEQKSLQYWEPRGYNTHAGDAMPFFHDGTFHVFYLVDRRHHRSKWGLGAHQWGHISTRDLKNWTQHPVALGISEEWEASICTGSVFYDKGKYYAFYATRMPDRTERLAMAVSNDGIHFEKVTPTPFAQPQTPYKIGPNRDPFAYGTGSSYRLLVTAELAQPALDHRGGALELLTSQDMEHWQVAEKPFLQPGYNSSQPECSNLFGWGKWSYLLFGQDGLTRYRMGKGAEGPWLAPKQETLDDAEAHVMKTAEFPGARRIGVAFVAKSGFGGVLCFRELVQLPDGTLGTGFVPEMIPAQGAEMTWTATG